MRGGAEVLIGFPGARGVIILLCLSLAGSLLSVFVYDTFIVQKTVVVDIARYITVQRDDYAAGRITAAELVANIDHLLKHLQYHRGEYVVVPERPGAGKAEQRMLSGDEGKVEEDDPEGPPPS